MFIGLLSACTIESFCELIVFNSQEPIKWVKSLNNKTCQTRPTIVNINSDKTIFIHF